MITSEDVSFVVQGPIINSDEISTIEVCNSIRSHFPGSEIILSTWEDSDTSNIIYDKLVVNKDPGYFIRNDGLPININRLILSTINGIKVASRKFLVKTRTDILFKKNFLYSIDVITAIEGIFNNYVTTIDFFSRDPLKIPFLFHPSDIFFIGMKEDIEQIFSCDLARQSQMLLENGESNLAPEQYLWMSLLIKKSKINNYNMYKDFSKKNIYTSELLFFNNFKVTNASDIGIILPKRLINGYMPNTNYKTNLQNWLDIKYFLTPILFFRAFLFGLTINMNRINSKIKRLILKLNWSG